MIRRIDKYVKNHYKEEIMKKYSHKFYLKLYQTMLKIRLCEEGLVEPIKLGVVLCPSHLYSGEEAVAAGVCAALQDKDYIFGTHRSHGHYLAKGGDMAELIAEIYCKETGCCRGRGGSMHIISPERGMMGSAPIVAGTISLALGAALASSLQKDRRVTVSFFGDGAAGEGVLYEALNIAALKNLPILFACENNLYSTHMPIRECRVTNNIYVTGKSFHIFSRRVDGNDVLKVYEASKSAVELCRSGRGPAFFEFMTYRFRGHVGPDDNIQGVRTDIRPPKEIERWKKRDPIKRFEKFLMGKAGVKKKSLEEIVTEAEKEVEEAFAFARRSPYPKKGDFARYVFK